MRTLFYNLTKTRATKAHIYDKTRLEKNLCRSVLEGDNIKCLHKAHTNMPTSLHIAHLRTSFPSRNNISPLADRFYGTRTHKHTRTTLARRASPVVLAKFQPTHLSDGGT